MDRCAEWTDVENGQITEWTDVQTGQMCKINRCGE
jgi:hypothetical protein